MVDRPDTMVDLPDSMVDLPDTMVDVPDTMVDLPDTMVDLPDAMLDLPTALRPYCSWALGLKCMLKQLLSSSLMEVMKPGCPGNVESGETTLS